MSEPHTVIKPLSVVFQLPNFDAEAQTAFAAMKAGQTPVVTHLETIDRLLDLIESEGLTLFPVGPRKQSFTHLIDARRIFGWDVRD